MIIKNQTSGKKRYNRNGEVERIRTINILYTEGKCKLY